jgi:hypothetical protein
LAPKIIPPLKLTLIDIKNKGQYRFMFRNRKFKRKNEIYSSQCPNVETKNNQY